MTLGDRFPAIGVIADDMSGATLCGAILRQAGLRCVVVSHMDDWPARPEAIVVNVGTRELAAQGAPMLVHDSEYIVCNAARRLVSDLGISRLELRVDGGLRREYWRELRGLIAGSPYEAPIVFAAPAHPRAGRITRHGDQVSFIPGRPDASAGRAVQAAPRLFGSEAATVVPCSVTQLGPEAVAHAVMSNLHTSRYVLAEADSDQQLRVLASAAALLGERHAIVTISSGAWLQFHPVLPPRPQFVLVAMGLWTGPNERQLCQLLEGTRRRLMLPHEAIGMGLPGSGFDAAMRVSDTIIIRAQPEPGADPGRPGDDRARLDAANQVAEGVEAVLEKAHRKRVRCRGIIATGDYTAASVVRRLSADGLEPVREIVPHCAVEAKMSRGQWTGLPIIIKSGSVGGSRALCDLVDALLGAP